MKQLLRLIVARCYRLSPGITLTELMVVLAIMGILSAMALPSYVQWRDSITYRETASDMASMLRRAKSEAVSRNREYLVEIDPDPANIRLGKRFGMVRGNRSVAVSFADIVANPRPTAAYTAVPDKVTLVPLFPAPATLPVEIVFSPNGTAVKIGTVQIQDPTGTTRYWVDVAQSGRVRVCSSWPKCL